MEQARPGARDALPCERVLVVNDDEDMLTTMREVLENAGVLVMTAASAGEARQVLRAEFSPGAIVVDLRLGGGERGDEFACRLRADPRYWDVPVLLMSADRRELQRLVAPADATITKPFDIDRLYDILSDLCSAGAAPGDGAGLQH